MTVSDWLNAHNINFIVMLAPATLFIMNMGTEHSYGNHIPLKRSLLTSLQRNFWLARKGDTVFSPIGLSDDFLDYICRILEHEPNDIEVACFESLLDDQTLIDNIKTEIFFSQIKNSGRKYSINPCFFSPGVARLADIMHKPPKDDISFLRDNGIRLFNRKSSFRDIASRLGLPIPIGQKTSSFKELVSAIKELLNNTGFVILKTDDGAGGEGNLLVCNGDPIILPGVSTAISALDLHSERFRLWVSDNIRDKGNAIIAEIYQPWCECFYFEFVISDEHTIDFSHCGDVHLKKPSDTSTITPIWKGLGFPSKIKESNFSAAFEFAFKFTKYAASIGLRGTINIDAIEDINGSLFFNECNARWGGGTSAFYVAKHILGTNFPAYGHAKTIRGLTCSNIESIEKRLTYEGLHYTPENKEGCIVHVVGDGSPGSAEILLLSKDRQRVKDMEQQVVQLLGGHDAQ